MIASSGGASVTTTLCSVTLPLLVATIVYVLTFPTRRSSYLLSPFVIDSSGFGTAVTVSGAHCCAAPVAFTQARSAKEPLSRSPCVIVCVPMQVIDAPGDRSDTAGGLQLNASRGGESVKTPLC